MGTLDDKFRKVRLDQSPYLFHFVKGTRNEAKEVLAKILEENRLVSRNNAICFTASPVTSLLEFFNTNVNRTGQPLYQSFGIGFSREIMIDRYGARNVIYCGNDDISDVPKSMRWRTQLLQVNEYDFEYLREWRIPVSEFDFSEMSKEHIVVIAPDLDDLNDLVVKFEMEFNPIVDYYNGNVEPNWDEAYIREWRGISLTQISETLNTDYKVLKEANGQEIGEDMVDSLIQSFQVYMSKHKVEDIIDKI